MAKELVKIKTLENGIISITIFLKPIPWSAPRIARGKAYSKHSKYKQFVKSLLRSAYKGKFLTGPLRCDMSFYLKKSNKVLFHVTKPDRINLGKLAEDILEGIFFKNDSAIVAGDVSKWAADEERMEIMLAQFNEKYFT